MENCSASEEEMDWGRERESERRRFGRGKDEKEILYVGNKNSSDTFHRTGIAHGTCVCIYGKTWYFGCIAIYTATTTQCICNRNCEWHSTYMNKCEHWTYHRKRQMHEYACTICV